MAKKSTDWWAYNPIRLGHCNEEPRIIARTHTRFKEKRRGPKRAQIDGPLAQHAWGTAMKRTITGGPSSLGALAGLDLFLFLKKFLRGTDNKFFEKKI